MSDAFDQVKNMKAKNNNNAEEQGISEKQFCENCGKEMILGAKKCTTCGFLVGGSIKEKKITIKQFIINIGRFFIDLSVLFGVLIAIGFILSGIFLFLFHDAENVKNDIAMGVMYFVWGFLLLLAVIGASLLYYIFIDIRDLLESIEQKIQRISHEKMS